eukprot:71341-Rhodomonas_salina.1
MQGQPPLYPGHSVWFRNAAEAQQPQPFFAMANTARGFIVEEPKFEQLDGRTEEEAFKDYTTELENWAFLQEQSDWVVDTND